MGADPSQDRRIDLYRRGRQFLAVARSASAGSLGLLFEGEIGDDDRERLGRLALEWLEASRGMDPPGSGFHYPEDLLPDSWDVIRWHGFMSEASLCAVERVAEERLVLRPYKNLHPVGEEFSHEGGHALDSPPEAATLSSALRAALDVAESISRIRRGPRYVYTAAADLEPGVVTRLTELGARHFERPARTEVVEIHDGFFLLPTPLRQLIFDVVWRRGSRVKDGLDRVWEACWLPVTVDPAFRAYPLFSLFKSDETELMIRLDSEHPEDPEVYRVGPGKRGALDSVLGAPTGAPRPGPALSKVLETLEIHKG